MKVRPLHDRLLLRRIEGEEKTKGGLIIPDTAKEKPMEGKIIAVGKGKVDEDPGSHMGFIASLPDAVQRLRAFVDERVA
jgi:chaperonin GroES